MSWLPYYSPSMMFLTWDGIMFFLFRILICLQFARLQQHPTFSVKDCLTNNWKPHNNHNLWSIASFWSCWRYIERQVDEDKISKFVIIHIHTYSDMQNSFKFLFRKMHLEIKISEFYIFWTLFHSMALCNWRMQKILLLVRELQLSSQNAGLFLSLFGYFMLLLLGEDSRCLLHHYLMTVTYDFIACFFLPPPEDMLFPNNLICLQLMCCVLFSNSVLIVSSISLSFYSGHLVMLLLGHHCLLHLSCFFAYTLRASTVSICIKFSV